MANTFYHFGGIIVPPGYLDPIQFQAGNPYGTSHVSANGTIPPGDVELAAMALEKEGVSAEIIDLRSLSPYDWEAISQSVGKTNRVLVAYEDMRSWGYGAEIAAKIRARVKTELGLAISVGVARTKHLAKIASQVAKPDGLVVVDPNALVKVASYLVPLWAVVVAGVV